MLLSFITKLIKNVHARQGARGDLRRVRLLLEAAQGCVHYWFAGFRVGEDVHDHSDIPIKRALPGKVACARQYSRGEVIVIHKYRCCQRYMAKSHGGFCVRSVLGGMTALASHASSSPRIAPLSNALSAMELSTSATSKCAFQPSRVSRRPAIILAMQWPRVRRLYRRTWHLILGGHFQVRTAPADGNQA